MWTYRAHDPNFYWVSIRECLYITSILFGECVDTCVSYNFYCFYWGFNSNKRKEREENCIEEWKSSPWLMKHWRLSDDAPFFVSGMLVIQSGRKIVNCFRYHLAEVTPKHVLSLHCSNFCVGFGLIKYECYSFLRSLEVHCSLCVG
jgi:hypothetical protein